MNKSLKRKPKASSAEDNVTITVKTQNGNVPLKKGTPLDHSTKHPPQSGVKFGISKGLTKNMDNFESLRVDVWLNSEVEEGETLQEAFDRVDSILNDELERAVLSVLGEE